MTNIPTAAPPPLLARFAAAADDGPPLPQDCITGHDGLLRRVGDDTPLIDRLLTARHGPGLLSQETKAHDQPDPDLVRPVTRTAADLLLVTTRTFAQAEPADPDLIRPQALRPQAR